jgi:hypothetical protein
MERNPIRNDARRTRRIREVGPHTCCVRCGTTTPETLIAARRSLLEHHHVVGRAHDDGLTVPLCRNCHAVLTEAQRDAGVDLTPPPTILHQLAAILAGLAYFFADLGRLCAAWATRLGEAAAGFDAAYPGWRGEPWARPVMVSP